MFKPYEHGTESHAIHDLTVENAAVQDVLVRNPFKSILYKKQSAWNINKAP
jgi:hypothetical protein